MRYLALIYSEERTEPQEMTPESMIPWMKFGEEATARGANPLGDALQPASTATTVRVRDGKMLTTDGPFAETKEVLGGYYVLECPSLDVAIELAAKIPAAEYGSIEVRPIMEIPGA
ncbi:MAG: YciI family protein [Chloroflexi bacterium]|nr:YciI family protein [Chloroflexota bacterium]MDA1145437.1 YciI family protein [Chloroflexota bacterium]